MFDLDSIINHKNSTRSMSDEDFNSLLPLMSQALSQYDYVPRYSDDELRLDWDRLMGYTSDSCLTSSQVRYGMKLCEHFFPNFYKVQNAKGVSFADCWAPDKLTKVLTWNRKSHSTPYLSELRRGVYFCNGLVKSTMYRPHLAKTISDFYQADVVLDPCCGWGGRLLGTVASGAHYIGFEPNIETYTNLLRLVDFLGIADKVSIYNIGAENMDSVDFTCDLVLTSPPYFNTEVYSLETSQSIANKESYDQWSDEWLRPVVLKSLTHLRHGGVSCWNGDNKLLDLVGSIHAAAGWQKHKEFGIMSSARQTNQNAAKNKKTKNMTICWKMA